MTVHGSKHKKCIDNICPSTLQATKDSDTGLFLPYLSFLTLNTAKNGSMSTCTNQVLILYYTVINNKAELHVHPHNRRGLQEKGYGFFFSAGPRKGESGGQN